MLEPEPLPLGFPTERQAGVSHELFGGQLGRLLPVATRAYFSHSLERLRNPLTDLYDRFRRWAEDAGADRGFGGLLLGQAYSRWRKEYGGLRMGQAKMIARTRKSLHLRKANK